MRFQMEAFRSAGESWELMQDGAAGHVWKPRPTAIDAIAKCMAWTGFAFIPAMRVRDLADGEIVWCRSAPAYLAHVQEIAHPDEPLAQKAAVAMLEGRPPENPSAQESLF